MNMLSAIITNIWSDDPKDNPEDDINLVIDDIEVQKEVDEAIAYATKKDSNSKKSKTLSEEHKRKMEEGRRRYWESKRAAEAAAEIVNEERKRKMQEGRQRYLENRRAESEEEEIQPPAKRRKVEFAEPISQVKIISLDTASIDAMEKKHIEELNSLQSTISKQHAYITQYSQLLAQRDEAIRSQVDLVTRYRDTIVHLQTVTKEQYQAIIYNNQIIVQNKDLITRQQQIIADQHSLILNLTTKGGVAALESGMAMDIASERHANSSSSSSQ